MIDCKTIAKDAISIAKRLVCSKPVVLPSENALEEVLDRIFWASLEKYEGNHFQTRVFFVPSTLFDKVYGNVFAIEPTQLTADELRRLSQVCSGTGGLAVVETPKGVQIRGIVAQAGGWLSVESSGPGILRVSSFTDPILEFNRKEIKVLSGSVFDRSAAEVLLTWAKLFPDDFPSNTIRARALFDIGFEIEKLRTGGAIWILPSDCEHSDLVSSGVGVDHSETAWEPYREVWERRSSTLRLLNPDCEDRYLFLQDAAQHWDTSRKKFVSQSVANFAKLDGAILMDGTPRFLAFGVVFNSFTDPTKTVILRTDPSKEAVDGATVEPSYFGGSRHCSAIDFCSTFAPAGAIVASHDGGLTVFAAQTKGQVVGGRVSMISAKPLEANPNNIH